MIFAFDHEHRVGDICSRAQCGQAKLAPVLCGEEEFDDVPMLIIRAATRDEYLNQTIPDGWCIPPLVYGCEYLYEIMID